MERTKEALDESELEVEYFRWGDTAQKSDFINLFVRTSRSRILINHVDHMRTVYSKISEP
jgi:hypothetical protein